MEDAVKLMEGWARAQLAASPAPRWRWSACPAARRSSSSRCPGDSDDTVLLYGHLDKQPEMNGWCGGHRPLGAGAQGRQALRPRRRRRRLCDLCLRSPRCGRCTSRRCRARRCVIMIEACEESGSYDLPYYVDHLAAAHRQARPSSSASTRAAATTSGCGCTTSLRGIAAGTLTVRVLTEGVHSGDASGIVPSSLPHPARAALAPRGRGHGRDQAARALRPDPAAARRAGQGGGARAGQGGLGQVPLRRAARSR